jgi:hypothetical protein
MEEKIRQMQDSHYRTIADSLLSHKSEMVKEKLPCE